MTSKTYGKVLIRTLLALTVTLSSFVSTVRSANAESTTEDSLANQTQVEEPLNQDRAVSLIDSATSKPSVSLETLLISRPSRDESELGAGPNRTELGSIEQDKTDLFETETSEVNPSEQQTISNSLVRDNLVADSAESTVNLTETEEVQLAQDLGDTFAPLSPEEQRQRLLIDPDATDPITAIGFPAAVPSSTFLVPSAYGADWGDAFIGIAGETAGRRDEGIDGSAAVGIGFGDAVRNVGVEVNVGIISLDGFADDGIAGFKLHKVFPQAGNLAVAAGWTNPIKWGDATEENDTFYGVVTKQFRLRPNASNQLPLTASLGIGTGTFRSIGAFEADGNAANVFGSAGLRVIPQVSLISSWNGNGLGLATSVVPIKRVPFVLTLGVSDVTGNTNNGAQFQGSVGYAFRF